MNRKNNLIKLAISMILLSGCQLNIINNNSNTGGKTSSSSSLIISSSNDSSSLLSSTSTNDKISTTTSSSNDKTSSTSSSSQIVEKTLVITPSNFNKLSQIELTDVVENSQYPDEFTFKNTGVMKSNKIQGLKNIEMEVYQTYENLMVYANYNGSGTPLTAKKVTGDKKATYTYTLNGGSAFYIKNISTYSTHVYSIKITYTGTSVGGNQNSSSSSSNSSSSSKNSSYIDQESTYTGTYYNNVNLNLKDNALLKELRTLITNTHSHRTTYDELKTYMKKSDVSLKDSSKVVLIYSRYEVSNAWDPNNSWNREHVWPKSNAWYNESGGGSDLHHLRPEDNRVNSTRNNMPFGEVNGGTEAKLTDGRGSNCYYSGGYFEPQDSAKGDTARIIFYLLTRYSEADSYSITKVAQSMDMLLRWHELDPVDAWEINRNEVTFDYQGNRNPFIDHPALANAIWA